MKKMLLLICMLLSFGNLQANPDYILDICLQKNDDGKVSYFVNARFIPKDQEQIKIKDATEQQVSESIKKVFDIFDLRYEDAAIHIVPDGSCTIKDIYKLCRIIQNAGPQKIVIDSFLDIPGLKKIESVEIDHLQIIAVDHTVPNPFDTPVERPANTLKK